MQQIFNETNSQLFFTFGVVAGVSASALLILGYSFFNRNQNRQVEKSMAGDQVTELLECMTDGFFTVNKDWELTYANPVTKTFMALAGRGILAKTITEFFPSPDHEKFMAYYEKVARTGISRQFEDTYEGRFLKVHAYRTREGGVSIFYRDVTDEREAQIRLAISEAKFRTITEAMPQIVWSTLPNGDHDYYNHRWYEFTGVEPGSTDGEGWNSVFHLEDQDRAWSVWRHSLNTGEPYEIEYRLRHHSGEYRWTLGLALPVRSPSGEIIRWMGTCTDIQDQKQTQSELQSALKSRDEFLSLASHELKTPLTSLLLQTQFFKKRVKRNDPLAYQKEQVDQLADQTEKQVSRVSRLIDDMLDITRIRVGKLVMAREELDLCIVVKEVLEQLRCQFEVSPSGFPTIEVCEEAIGDWDKFRIEQVINNLLTNAVRYGEGKPIFVNVTSTEHFVKFSITDYGVGIAKENQQIIFNRFERAANPSQISGLGLGLFITKQIVKAHGGSIWVESELGKGSTFIVELPKKSAVQPSEGVDIS